MVARVLDLTLLAPGVVADQASAFGGTTDPISFGGMRETTRAPTCRW